MPRKIKIIQIKFWDFLGLKSAKSITLIELMISVIIVSLLILGFYGFEIFSNTQVLDSDRRAKVQNQLSFCLEHMSKFVQRADGNLNFPPIVATGSGFQVRVDFNNPQTPSVFSDDAVVTYALSGNDLSVACSGSNCPDLETPLSKQIISFTANVQGNLVEIDLVGRYNPSLPVMSGTSFVNPQVEVKTQIICNSSSTN